MSVVEFQSLSHIWVDSRTGAMTLHCLETWLPARASLTTVVEAAFEALSGRAYAPPQPDYPPARLHSPPKPAPAWSVPPPADASAAARGAAGPPSEADAAPAGWSGSEARRALEGRSTAELEALVLDGAAFAAFAQPFLASCAAGRRVEALRSEVIALAKENMALLDVRLCALHARPPCAARQSAQHCYVCADGKRA